MNKEKWKLYKLDNSYFVSNLGRFKSTAKRKNPTILKQSISNTGYLTIGLDRTRLSHLAVWETFFGSNEPGMMINHINGIKTDNRLINLECVTRSENVRHAIRNGLIKKSQAGKALLSELDVSTIRMFYKKGTCTSKILAKIYCLRQCTIIGIATKRNYKSYE